MVHKRIISLLNSQLNSRCTVSALQPGSSVPLTIPIDVPLAISAADLVFSATSSAGLGDPSPTPPLFHKFSNFNSDGMQGCRFVVLLLSTLIFDEGLFVFAFHKFSNFTPPPPPAVGITDPNIANNSPSDIVTPIVSLTDLSVFAFAAPAYASGNFCGTGNKDFTSVVSIVFENCFQIHSPFEVLLHTNIHFLLCDTVVRCRQWV